MRLRQIQPLPAWLARIPAARATRGGPTYFAESTAGRSGRYAAGPSTGAPGEPSVLASSADGDPGGMTADEDGHPRVAVRGGVAAHRDGPAGRLDRVLPTPHPQPTGIGLDPGRPGAIHTVNGGAPGRPPDA
ncbi:hypothetical protein [Nonomuraea aridisoli]|uniref:hypothetical protein n=1 Tax=Nonomuraea aridisoli TaxID=2070368 RepID=UPI0011B93516|nr:hypothetical protein [Nonomuraea aridisoli]